MSDHPELVFGWRSAIMLLAVLHLLIAAGLLWRRAHDRLANRILALFLLVAAGILTPQLIGFAGFYDAFPWLSFAPFDNNLAIGPLLLAYTVALTRGHLPKPFWWLMAPSIIAFFYSVYWFVQPLEDKWAWVDRMHDPFIQTPMNLLSIALAVYCVFASVVETRRYRRWLDRTTSVRSEFDPNWLTLTLGVFIVAVVVWSTTNLLQAFWQPLSYIQAFPSYLVMAASAYAIAQLALIKGSETFPKMAQPAPTVAVVRNGSDALRTEAQQLRDWVIDSALYLDPRLSIATLARRRSTNQSELSRLINQGLGVNFNRFINELRIEHAKDLLREQVEDILPIALASGFNSKATFNRVFREITRQTPSQYRSGVSNRFS
ncbi:MAG: AraC family transcriptional regulator [Pseudomonadota bacterium]